MDGFGYTKDLPEELSKTNDSVFIFHGNPAADGDKSGGLGKWENLKPGHGDGFSSNGKENKLSNRFGIEVELTACVSKTSARIYELPISYHPRTRMQGKKIGWKDHPRCRSSG